MDAPKIEIVSKNGKTQVFYEGTELKGATSVEFIHDAHSEAYRVPILRVSFFALNTTLDTDRIPEPPPEYARFYKR